MHALAWLKLVAGDCEYKTEQVFSPSHQERSHDECSRSRSRAGAFRGFEQRIVLDCRVPPPVKRWKCVRNGRSMYLPTLEVLGSCWVVISLKCWCKIEVLM
jgi:hypothetical protein